MFDHREGFLFLDVKNIKKRQRKSLKMIDLNQDHYITNIL